MASTSPTVAVKKEKKSKLWSTPPYPGNEQNTKHKGKKKKRRRAPGESSSGSSSGSSDPCDSESSSSDDSGSKSSNESAPKPASQNIVTAPAMPLGPHSVRDPQVVPKTPAPEPPSQGDAAAPAMTPDRHDGGDVRGAPSSVYSAPRSKASSALNQNTGRTHRVMTVSSHGWCLHPSLSAIRARMSCLYPDYHIIMNGVKDINAKGSASAQNDIKSHASHIRRVWTIVTTVDAEIRAKMSAGSQPNIDIHKSSPFGLQVYYSINLYAATKKLQCGGQVAKNTHSFSGSSNQKDGPPSHEEMMAYRILTPRYEFPPFIIQALRGTEFEYLMYPLVPSGPVIKDANAKSAPELSRMKKKIAELEARLEDADNRLKQADNKLSQQHLSFEAEREREGDAVRRRHDGYLLELKAHEARRANVKDMILNMQKSASKAANMHNQHLSSLQDLLDQVSQSREEEKVDKKGLRQVESSEGESSEGETSEEEENDEEDQRPAKIRRIS